jgi:hypothetical protein
MDEFIEIDIEGVTHLFYYAFCECTVYPLSALHRVGRCGNCGTRPFSRRYFNREKVDQAFIEYKRTGKYE